MANMQHSPTPCRVIGHDDYYTKLHVNVYASVKHKRSNDGKIEISNTHRNQVEPSDMANVQHQRPTVASRVMVLGPGSPGAIWKTK